MQTQTIERTETDERVDDGTDSDTPKYFHYVKKDKIAESAVMGTHVVALCGEVFPVTKAAKPGSPVCPDCKQIYDRTQEGLISRRSAVRRAGCCGSCAGPASSRRRLAGRQARHHPVAQPVGVRLRCRELLLDGGVEFGARS